MALNSPNPGTGSESARTESGGSERPGTSDGSGSGAPTEAGPGLGPDPGPEIDTAPTTTTATGPSTGTETGSANTTRSGMNIFTISSGTTLRGSDKKLLLPDVSKNEKELAKWVVLKFGDILPE